MKRLLPPMITVRLQDSATAGLKWKVVDPELKLGPEPVACWGGPPRSKFKLPL